MRNRIVTSEAVTEGHPDKLCDRIADEILDAILAEDPSAKVACEAMVMSGAVVLAGEITAACQVDYVEIARKAIRQVGYDDPKLGFCADTCAMIVNIHQQSPDIALGVDRMGEVGRLGEADSIGAGDQGMMFGFACDETPVLMPMSIHLANRLCQRMAEIRNAGTLPWMRPDGKSQVSIEYDPEGNPLRCASLILAAQHDPDVSNQKILQDMLQQVVEPVVPPGLIDRDTKILVNTTGRFVEGGPQADTGLTGRKLMVDTYGGVAPHGGGSFSGKDPTKMDRSGAYAARYVAKNIVAAGLARRCTVSLAYAIGVPEPVSMRVDAHGTGRLSEELLEDYVKAVFDLRPAAVIGRLDLRRPIFAPVSAYGHFGRSDLSLPWERTDIAEMTRRLMRENGGM